MVLNAVQQDAPLLKETCFTSFHRDAGARIVPFAGYSMPVSFAGGLAEHHHVRSDAGVGLFDVSHMGQITLNGNDVVRRFEKLVPSNIQDLSVNSMKYTVIMLETGGILDDCIVTKNADGSLFIVVNGSRKHLVLDYFRKHLKNIQTDYHDDCGLIALQGSGAISVLVSQCPQIASLRFMQSGHFQIEGINLRISRSGYTGEDGFEISVHHSSAHKLYKILTQFPNVQPIGLGARDTLRLEAGLCLYGNDIDETISPIEASLGWIVCKQRTQDEAYLGASTVKQHLQGGVLRKRVGLLVLGKAPVRQGAYLFNGSHEKIGIVTSGTLSPTLQVPIAMGYVYPDYSKKDTEIFAEVREKMLPVKVSSMPFVKHGYVK